MAITEEDLELRTMLSGGLFGGSCCGYRRSDIPKKYAAKIEAMMLVASQLCDDVGLRTLNHLHPVVAYACIKVLEGKDPWKKAVRMIKRRCE